MKMNTLEKVYLALRDLEPRIEMEPELLDAGAGARSTGCSR